MECKIIFVAFSIVLFSIVPFIPQSFSEIIETDISFAVSCDSPFPQLCEPPFTTNVETTSVLKVQYFASEMHCSSLRVHIFLDDTPVHTSDFFTWPSAPAPFDTLPSDTGVIDLGPVSEGIHKIDIQAEGQVSGCNTVGIGLWQGTARIFSDPPLLLPCGEGTVEGETHCVVDPAITQELVDANSLIIILQALIQTLQDRILELEELLGVHAPFTEEECDDIKDTIAQKEAAGKKVPPKLLSNLEICIELYGE